MAVTGNGHDGSGADLPESSRPHAVAEPATGLVPVVHVLERDLLSDAVSAIAFAQVLNAEQVVRDPFIPARRRCRVTEVSKDHLWSNCEQFAALAESGGKGLEPEVPPFMAN